MFNSDKNSKYVGISGTCNSDLHFDISNNWTQRELSEYISILISRVVNMFDSCIGIKSFSDWKDFYTEILKDSLYLILQANDSDDDQSNKLSNYVNSLFLDDDIYSDKNELPDVDPSDLFFEESEIEESESVEVDSKENQSTYEDLVNEVNYRLGNDVNLNTDTKLESSGNDLIEFFCTQYALDPSVKLNSELPEVPVNSDVLDLQECSKECESNDSENESVRGYTITCNICGNSVFVTDIKDAGERCRRCGTKFNFGDKL